MLHSDLETPKPLQSLKQKSVVVVELLRAPDGYIHGSSLSHPPLSCFHLACPLVLFQNVNSSSIWRAPLHPQACTLYRLVSYTPTSKRLHLRNSLTLTVESCMQLHSLWRNRLSHASRLFLESVRCLISVKFYPFSLLMWDTVILVSFIP